MNPGTAFIVLPILGTLTTFMALSESAYNPLTSRLLVLINWSFDRKIVGWILRIGGSIFLVAFVVQGFSFTIALLGSIIYKLRNREGGLNWLQKHLNWTWVFACFIWFPINLIKSMVTSIISGIFILLRCIKTHYNKGWFSG